MYIEKTVTGTLAACDQNEQNYPEFLHELAPRQGLQVVISYLKGNFMNVVGRNRYTRTTGRAAIVAALLAGTLLTATGGVSGASTLKASSAKASPAKTNFSGVTLNVAEQAEVYQSLLKASGQSNTPYHVNYVETASTSASLTDVQAGDVDLFVAGELPAVFGAAANYPFKLYEAEYLNVNSTGVLVQANSPITSVAQLAGKTVAVNLGSNAQKVLYHALGKAGLKPSSINLVNLAPAAALPLFVAGKIDAWATFDPNTSIAEVEYGARMLVDGANGISTGVNYLAASDAALANKQKFAAIVDYTNRLEKAYKWAYKTKNRAAYLKVQGSLDDLPYAVNLKEWLRGSPRFKPITKNVIKASQLTTDEFVSYGSISALNLTPFFTTAVDKKLAAPASTNAKVPF